MKTVFVILLGALTLASCINWQAGYDNAARRSCNEDPDDRARRACLDRAEQNAWDKAVDRREQRNASR